MILLQQMVVLFLIMVVGYVCSKLGYLNKEVTQKLSAIVVNIANPAIIIVGGITDTKLSTSEFKMILIIEIIIYLTLLILATIIPKILHVSSQEYGIYKAMTVFSNIGFMGIPMVKALYGTRALIYVVLFTIPYNILLYTYGVKVMNEQTTSFHFKDILNTGMIASVLSLVLYITGYKPPVILTSVLEYIGNIVAPISMMIIGASFVGIQFKDIISDKKLLLFSLIKMIFIPALGIGIIQRFVDNEVFIGVCLIMLATPVGSMTAMLAEQNNIDTSTATRGIALTTLISVISMPLLSLM